MQACLQSPEETIWDHCQSVSNSYFNLLQNPNQLPAIIQANWDFILRNQADPNVVKDYLEWHDCGKPFCITDSSGRISFPDHAAVSEKMFTDAGGKAESARLIGLDMVFHITKPAEILDLDLDTNTMATLMLSAWAALFANAAMFGGRESESFKIKQSQLIARCKKVFKL